MEGSLFINNERNKSEDFRQNENLNSLIEQLKNLLKPIQDNLEIESNKWPIGFILGNARSGSTLLLQWLASLGHFSYPTNLLSRFAYAPHIGALIQEMLFNPKFDFHDELFDIKSDVNFKSILGKSKGALATSEFQHYFRNYMPNFDPEYISDENIKKVNFQAIKNGLASIEHVYGKPFVVKGIMFQYNLESLFNTIPKSIFIFIKRSPLYNMQSLLMAREKYYSDRNIWWSVKPKEYQFLKNMDVYHQIAGQVFYTNKAITNELKFIPSKNKLCIEYEFFCKYPENVYAEIIHKYKANGYIITKQYAGEKHFNPSITIRLKNEDIRKLENAYEYFFKTSTDE
jgi:hypothetical protein